MKPTIILLVLTSLLVQKVSAQVTKEQQTSSGEKVDTIRQNDEVYLIKYRDPERFLALDKPGFVKRLHFYEGDDFVYKKVGEPKRINTNISSIGADYITSFNLKTKLDEIRSVTIYNKSWFVHQGSFYFPVFGLIYFAADMINPYFSGGETFYVTRETLTVTGGFILSGFLLHLLKKKTIRINKRHVVKIIERY